MDRLKIISRIGDATIFDESSGRETTGIHGWDGVCAYTFTFLAIMGGFGGGRGVLTMISPF